MIDFVNKFSLTYLAAIFKEAKNQGYEFLTLKQFLDRGFPSQKAFVLRHDLDCKPAFLSELLKLELDLSIRSTIYVRVTANDYNPFDYKTYPLLKAASDQGFELGLHSNFLEYAAIHNLDPEAVLKSELGCLRAFFDIKTLTPHRDVNYAVNALPWLEQNWSRLQSELKLDYQGYDKRFMDSSVYINEGLNPHLCWRTSTPEDILKTGRSIYMLLHPHWWYKSHPFEF